MGGVGKSQSLVLISRMIKIGVVGLLARRLFVSKSEVFHERNQANEFSG
jgi:hypothetical protein